MYIFHQKIHLLQADCAARAYTFAGAALDANLRVNRILFALVDCSYRALVNTCTACYAVT